MLSAPATIANLAPIFGRLKIKGIAAISVIKTARNSVNQSGDTLAYDLGSKPISKTVRTSRATTVPTTPHFANLGFILASLQTSTPQNSTFIILAIHFTARRLATLDSGASLRRRRGRTPS